MTTAMTLRLTDAQRDALAALATAQGTSRQVAAVTAIMEAAERVALHDDAMASLERTITRDAHLLDRLGT